MRFPWLALLGALWLVPSVAHADDLADEAELEFSLGTDAYQHADFKQALAHFLASNRLVPNDNVVFNIARCHEQLQQYPEAFRYYSLALERERDESVRAKIEAALAQLKSQIVVFHVTTEPAGATLYVDRRDLGPRGKSPELLGLRPGRHKLILELAGYEPVEQDQPDANAGEERAVQISLKQILGSAVISGDPAARARIDGAPAPSCALPCRLELAPGAHTARVERSGFHAADFTFTVSAHQTVNVPSALEPLTGSAQLSTDEPGALVEIDGKPRGYTPVVLTLPVGTHTLRVHARGFRTVEQPLAIREGENTDLNLVLTEAAEVVAASRVAENVDDAPSSVSLVPEHELRLFAAPTIAEAVRGVPGVYITDDRSYVTLGVRGLGRLGDYGNRMLVTYDGQPVNDDWLGSSYVGYDALSDLGDVERIEVVRGAGSVLYGTNAFSGVINVVSRDDAPTGVTGGVSTNLDGVARARVRGDLELGKDGHLWLSVSGARGEGRDFSFPGLVAPDGSDVAQHADGFQSGTLRGRASWKFWTASWSLHSTKKHLPTAEYDTLFGDPRTAQTDTRAFVELKAEPKLSEQVTLLSRAHWNLYRFRGTYARDAVDDGVELDTFHGGWFGVEQRVQLTPIKALRLTLGGELQVHYQVLQTGADDTGSFLHDSQPFKVGALYALGDADLSSRAHVSLGARLDSYSTFGSSVNPRAAVIYKPYDGGNTKLVGGKAFRAPSIYELYYNDGGFTQVASHGLSPESMITLELEHAHHFSPALVGTVAVYADHATHMIAAQGSSTMGDPLHYQNEPDPIEILGGEIGLRRDFRQGLMLSASYGLSVARFLRDDSAASVLGFSRASDKRNVENAPVQLAAFKAAVSILPRTLVCGTRLTLQGPRYDRYENQNDPAQGHTAGAAIWDLVLSGEETRHGLRYAFGVYNAFDWRYRVPLSREFTQNTIEQDGRTFLASLDAKF
ncbi:MAG TPA: TonB-dependent receptor [Polyangiaceae bacterium]